MTLPDISSFSFSSILGSDGVSGLSSGNNFVLPLGTIFLLWMVVGRVARLAMGFLPLLAVVLLMLGQERGLESVVGDAGGGLSQAGGTVGSFLSSQGWLLPVLTVLALLFFAQQALWTLQTLIPIGIILFLIFSRDYRLESVLHNKATSSASGLIIGGLVLLWLLRRFFLGRRDYSSNPTRGISSLVPKIEWSQLQPVAKYFATALGGICAFMMVSNPPGLEQALPGWRQTYGVGLLFLALFALGASMPQRFRPWLVPSFWATVCLIIAVQVFWAPGEAWVPF